MEIGDRIQYQLTSGLDIAGGRTAAAQPHPRIYIAVVSAFDEGRVLLTQRTGWTRDEGETTRPDTWTPLARLARVKTISQGVPVPKRVDVLDLLEGV